MDLGILFGWLDVGHAWYAGKCIISGPVHLDFTFDFEPSHPPVVSLP